MVGPVGHEGRMMPKRKLPPAEKARKKGHKAEYMTVFMNRKQKRVRRPLILDGMGVDEFIRRNADPIWLHQNEMWEYIEVEPLEGSEDGSAMEFF